MLIAVPAVIVVLLLAAWGVDTRGHDGRVARNVSLAGHSVGGDSRDEVTAEVDRQADAARNEAVHIVTQTTSYDTTAEALGLSIEQPATVDAVMKADHGGNVVARPFRWMASLFSTKKTS